MTEMLLPFTNSTRQRRRTAATPSLARRVGVRSAHTSFGTSGSVVGCDWDKLWETLGEQLTH